MFIGGCATSVKSTYSPVSPPTYTKRIGDSVTIASVIDKRNVEGTGYYKSFQIWDKSNYERNVSDIVGDALQTELTRAGASILKSGTSGSTQGNIILKAEILEYLAEVTRPTGLFVSDVLDLKVSVRFRWTDSKGKLLGENTRNEHVTRKLGVGKGPVLPYDGAQVRGYGEELLNTLLPRVIEKEIRYSKVFNK